MEWWLISRDDVEKIKAALECTIETVDDYCTERGCVCTLPPIAVPYIKCSRAQRDALHAIDTGCYATDAIPDELEYAPMRGRQAAIKALFVLLRYIIHTK